MLPSPAATSSAESSTSNSATSEDSSTSSSTLSPINGDNTRVNLTGRVELNASNSQRDGGALHPIPRVVPITPTARASGSRSNNRLISSPRVSSPPYHHGYHRNNNGYHYYHNHHHTNHHHHIGYNHKPMDRSDCSKSIYYLYLLAIMSSGLVVSGFYFSLMRFDAYFLCLSLLGLVLVALGACIYCLCHLRMNRSNRRKNHFPRDISDSIENQFAHVLSRGASGASSALGSAGIRRQGHSPTLAALTGALTAATDGVDLEIGSDNTRSPLVIESSAQCESQKSVQSASLSIVNSGNRSVDVESTDVIDLSAGESEIAANRVTEPNTENVEHSLTSDVTSHQTEDSQTQFLKSGSSGGPNISNQLSKETINLKNVSPCSSTFLASPEQESSSEDNHLVNSLKKDPSSLLGHLDHSKIVEMDGKQFLLLPLQPTKTKRKDALQSNDNNYASTSPPSELATANGAFSNSNLDTGTQNQTMSNQNGQKTPKEIIDINSNNIAPLQTADVKPSDLPNRSTSFIVRKYDPLIDSSSTRTDDSSVVKFNNSCNHDSIENQSISQMTNRNIVSSTGSDVGIENGKHSFMSSLRPSHSLNEKTSKKFKSVLQTIGNSNQTMMQEEMQSEPSRDHLLRRSWQGSSSTNIRKQAVAKFVSQVSRHNNCYTDDSESSGLLAMTALQQKSGSHILSPTKRHQKSNRLAAILDYSRNLEIEIFNKSQSREQYFKLVEEQVENLKNVPALHFMHNVLQNSFAYTGNIQNNNGNKMKKKNEQNMPSSGVNQSMNSEPVASTSYAVQENQNQDQDHGSIHLSSPSNSRSNDRSSFNSSFLIQMENRNDGDEDGDEIMGINENDIDNMSIPPPSYESLMGPFTLLK